MPNLGELGFKVGPTFSLGRNVCLTPIRNGSFMP